jgi:hypothetical protein
LGSSRYLYIYIRIYIYMYTHTTGWTKMITIH